MSSSTVLVFKGVATKDPPKKKRKRWVDCTIEYDPRNGAAKLYQQDENGKRGAMLGVVQKRQAFANGEEIEFESGWLCEVEEQIDSLVDMEHSTVPSNPPRNSRMTASCLPAQSSHCRNTTLSRRHLPVLRVSSTSQDIPDGSLSFDSAGPKHIESAQMKRPRTDAEILSMFGGSQSPAKSEDERKSQSVLSPIDIQGATALEIFVDLMEGESHLANCQGPTSNNTQALFQRARTVIPPYRPPSQQVPPKLTSLARPNLPSSSMATARSIAADETGSTLRPPTHVSNLAGMRRTVTYPPRFGSLEIYLQKVRLGWEEEIQTILDQSWERIRLNEQNVFKSSTTLQCVKFGGKTMPAGKRYYLHAPKLKERSKFFSVGDVWIITQTSHNDTSATITLWESAWYGASAENKLELKPLTRNLPKFVNDSMGPANLSVTAVHGPCIRTELTALRLLEDCPRLRDASSSPAMITSLIGSSALCGADQRIPVQNWPELEAIVNQFIELFGLNVDQADVVWAIVRKVYRTNFEAVAPKQEDSTFVLVNGPFGSGKSQTIACCVLVLDAIAIKFAEAPHEGKSLRIGVAAATNVAVDRVLTCLLKDQDFESIARIGSVRAVDHSLLKKMIHYSKNAVSEARSELLRLKERDASAAEDVNIALESLTRAQEIADAARVTGFTCCSSENEEMGLVFPLNLDGSPSTFNVLFLDEGSQMPEPVALLPIANSKANVVCIFGDLKQLPPVSPFPPSKHESGGCSSISMTLFERLSRIHSKDVFTLRTSFRCHPDICRLASDLFYDGNVVPGTDASMRGELLEGLAPISILDVSNGLERRGTGGSYQNEQECFAIKRVVKRFEEAGVAPERIAITTLFVAQSNLLRAHIMDINIRVATVDAFQGAESDILIVSTCRTERSQFSEQMERLNVLLTRARHHLVVVGSRFTLSTSPLWKRVCDKASVFEMNY